MQQLYLTGPHASALAERLFHAMNVRPAGFCLLAFAVGGEVRGQALHLLHPPAAPLHNDVPCRIELCRGRFAVVQPVLEEIAAPALRSANLVHAPMLLDCLTADLLACPSFRDSIRACLLSDHAVVAVVQDDAVDALRALTPEECQLWMPVPEEAEKREALLEALITEAAMRF